MSKQRLGKYVLGPRLARGGMAEVFLASAQGPGGFVRPVAIKRLLPHLAERPELVAMFLEEATLARRLHHPHIAQVQDLGLHRGEHFLCLEYLAGEDLGSVIAQAHATGKPVPADLVARIAACLAEALHFAHTLPPEEVGAQGVVHGDVSPSNVLVTFVGEVKLIDFGIARRTGEKARLLPGVQGKLSYLAPEQLAGAELDRRTDLFSLGVVMHELATGERLFRRDTDAQTLSAVTDEPIPDPRTRRPDLPAPLAEIILRALERRPERRFQSGEELRIALDAFLGTVPYAKTSVQLGNYLRSIFSAARISARTAILQEPTRSATQVLDAGLQPLQTSTGLAVPLVAERPKNRSGLVRVVGEVPGALLRAGYNLVAVPASVVSFAVRWPRRRLAGAAIATLLAGFASGVLVREVHEAVARHGRRAPPSEPVAAPAPKPVEKPKLPERARAEEAPPELKRSRRTQAPDRTNRRSSS